MSEDVNDGVAVCEAVADELGVSVPLPVTEAVALALGVAECEGVCVCVAVSERVALCDDVKVPVRDGDPDPEREALADMLAVAEDDALDR